MNLETKLCFLFAVFSEQRIAAAQSFLVPAFCHRQETGSGKSLSKRRAGSKVRGFISEDICAIVSSCLYIPELDLPEQLLNGLNELLSGKYLNGLLDILQFQSFSKWTPDLDTKILLYLSAQNASSVWKLQTSVKKYLEDLSEDPECLLSELQKLHHESFPLAMNYLLGGKKEHFDMAGVVVDFETMREGIFQSPIGNRSIFNTTLQKCLPALTSADCVKILGEVIRMYEGMYLQTDMIAGLPTEIADDPFRNLSSVFRDLYDKLTANTRRALYEWITQTLQNSYAANGFD